MSASVNRKIKQFIRLWDPKNNRNEDNKPEIRQNIIVLKKI